jgi:sugar phosphate isomerase/epimerase
MAEFRTEYYTPMDRAYHERMNESSRPVPLEEPIFPIAQLGQTVPEHDPSGRHKNILQNVQAAIRGGTGNLQIVFQTPIESAIGGRPKAYGTEVREAIKEVAMANEVLITGMEMPTSLTNMSGWDPQRGLVDEAKRQRDLDEVKEMIRFAAEVGRGGGVDIVSWEYNRPAFRQKWFEEDKTAQKAFKQLKEQEKKFEEVRFVDERSGAIVPIPIREGIFIFKDPKNFRDLSPFAEKKEERTPKQWQYDDFERYAEHLRKNPRADHPEDKEADAHTLIKQHFIESQQKIAEAEAGYYHQRLMQTKNEIKGVDRALTQGIDPESGNQLTAEQRAQLERTKQSLQDIQKRELAGIEAQERVAAEHRERMLHWVPMEEYTLKRSAQSYAEAGLSAMKMQDTMGPKKIIKDLYVGPEIGWPQYYGSHPEEFVQVILNAREHMVDVLTNKDRSNQFKDFGFKNPLSRSQAEEEARKHIKGTFDTGHMGMWLQNFHPDMPWEQRKKEFTKWYKEKMEWLADQNKKHDIIGAIQAVDSAGAAHGHLPAGQGILPVKEALEILKTKGGFSGYIASEGHEEERFGEGRITLKTWQEFNAPISGGGYSGAGAGMAPRRWNEVRHGYFGRTYSPNFMFGAYAPSNEFKLWSEVPLE